MNKIRAPQAELLSFVNERHPAAKQATHAISGKRKQKWSCNICVVYHWKEDFFVADISYLNEISICIFCKLESKVTLKFWRRVSGLKETLNAKSRNL